MISDREILSLRRHDVVANVVPTPWRQMRVFMLLRDFVMNTEFGVVSSSGRMKE